MTQLFSNYCESWGPVHKSPSLFPVFGRFDRQLLSPVERELKEDLMILKPKKNCAAEESPLDAKAPVQTSPVATAQYKQ
jgi:hypothetical protein